MQAFAQATEYLINEGQSMITRLQQVKPFTMTMPMVRGASISAAAAKAVTELLERGKSELYKSVNKFIATAQGAENDDDTLRELQTGFTLLKLRFNAVLDQLDIFADVLAQRGEHDVGIWLAGLDALAEDGMAYCKGYCEDAPPLVVFLERGHGAAIRRARTRLPGGDENPIGVIQIPRERLVGSGIASSLIHEVGHQAAESMNLTKSLRAELKERIASTTRNRRAWMHYERWISEIVADCWAMGNLGVSATLGLMGVVTLPKYFQFRLDLDDPHPAPYYRVKISCAFGNVLFPHRQWSDLWKLWELFYPAEGIGEEKTLLLRELDEELNAFVEVLANHQSKALRGRRFADLFPLEERRPARLREMFQKWRRDNALAETVPPTLVFAVLGQAKHDKLISAAEENQHLTQLLRTWAFNKA